MRHSLGFSDFHSGYVADTPQTINQNTLNLSEEMQEKEKKNFVSVFVFHSLLDSRSLHAEGTKICNMNLEHKCRRILAFSDIFFKDYLQLRIFEWTTFVILVKKPGVTFIPGGLGPHRLYLILNGKRRGHSFQW